MAGNLTDKQELFVHEYLLDGNATRAAKSAGYSEESAYSIGSELLRNPEVSDAIAKRFNKRLQRLELSADKVLQELCKLAFYDPRNFYNSDGSLKHPTELDDNTAMALAGMDIEEAYEHFGKGQAKATGVIKKIKLADKGQNLERLGRTFKLFTDRVEHSGDASLAEAISQARKRAAKRNG
jgi:phage terminase small subunit